MTTKNIINPENVHTEVFEPFPEPRTFPEGWDLSAVMPEQNVEVSLPRNLVDQT
jgi:hypothetical protein